MNKRAPVNRMRPIHPGEFLREDCLKPLGLTEHALALALRVPASRINDIVLERRAVTADTALRRPVISAAMGRRGSTCRPNTT